MTTGSSAGSESRDAATSGCCTSTCPSRTVTSGQPVGNRIDQAPDRRLAFRGRGAMRDREKCGSRHPPIVPNADDSCSDRRRQARTASGAQPRSQDVGCRSCPVRSSSAGHGAPQRARLLGPPRRDRRTRDPPRRRAPGRIRGCGSGRSRSSRPRRARAPCASYRRRDHSAGSCRSSSSCAMRSSMPSGRGCAMAS